MSDHDFYNPTVALMNRRRLSHCIVLMAIVGLILTLTGCMDSDNPKQTGVNIVPAEPPPAPNGMMKVGKKR